MASKRRLETVNVLLLLYRSVDKTSIGLFINVTIVVTTIATQKRKKTFFIFIRQRCIIDTVIVVEAKIKSIHWNFFLNHIQHLNNGRFFGVGQVIPGSFVSFAVVRGHLLVSRPVR